MTRYIRSDEIAYQKPSEHDYLVTYNELLSEILVNNSSSLAALASATINRLEAQTHFFEKIEKYIQIHKLLSDNSNISVMLIDNDRFCSSFLKKEFKGRVVCQNYVSLKDNPVVGLVWFFRLWISSLLKTLFLTSHLRITKRKLSTSYESIMRTWFDFRCQDIKGNLREEYFGPFIDDLARKSKTLVVFKLLHFRDFRLYLKLSRHASFDSCLIESFLTPWTVLISYGSYLFVTLFNQIKLDNKIYYKDVNITPLLKKSVRQDFLFLRGLGVYIEHEAAKHIFKKNPERLYFPYENQTWEKVYPLVRKRHSNIKTKIIGFQHTGLSYKLLNYFPAKNDRELPYFPDTILTVGKITKKILEEKAFYSSKIIEGAALRHMKHLKNGEFLIKSPQPTINKKIVYAFSYDYLKYKNILSLLIAIFQNTSITVYLKIHPDYQEDEIINSLRITLPANFVLAQHIPWNNIYASVDLVLYDDNSIGIEGIINGVKTYMLDAAEPIYDCNRMYYFPDLWDTSVDEQALKRIREMLEDNTFNKIYDVNQAKEYIYRYYNIYNPKIFTAYFDKVQI